MAAKYKSPRKAIPVRVEQAVLAKSARRCTLCFGLAGDLTEKLGQIAHVDGDRTNNAESNPAWMCLDHHSVFDSRTKQHKNYTVAEVKAHRKRLYALVSRGKRLVERTSRHGRDGSAPPAPSSTLTTQGAEPWLDLFREKKRLEAEVEALKARPDLETVPVDAPLIARRMTRGEMRKAEQI